MELLKGSEKQKAWATQIITDARNTIARNIALANERKAQYPTGRSGGKTNCAR